jgi:hypothetical protein
MLRYRQERRRVVGLPARSYDAPLQRVDHGGKILSVANL